MALTRTAQPSLIRAMQAADIDEAAAVSARTFEVDMSREPVARRWHGRLEHLLRTDPDGSFVAERDGRIIAVSMALKREGFWCLSLLTTDPAVQSSGAGRAVFDRSLAYGADCPTGMIVASNDPRALRLYATAGFHPRATFEALGPLDRRTIPRLPSELREGDASDLEALEPISREIRGAPHTAELAMMLGQQARLLRFADRGFSVALPGRGVWLLAARDEETAKVLLWGALELAGECPEAYMRWITTEQTWAIQVALDARLRLSAYGALCVRGNPGPLWPYLPSPPFA